MMLVPLLSRILDTLHRWRRLARQRRRLWELDDHMLKDLGLSRVDALREAERRPWDDSSNGDATLRRHRTEADTGRRKDLAQPVQQCQGVSPDRRFCGNVWD